MIRRIVPGADPNPTKSETSATARNRLTANIEADDGLYTARMQMIVPLSPEKKFGEIFNR
jgi:hypothetical protein